MSKNKLAEYLLQQDVANKLKQAAIDESVTQLVESIESTFKAIEQLKAIAPDYDITKLSKFRKLAGKFNLTESVASKTKAGKRKGRAKTASAKFTLSDEKAKEILEYIGADEKSTAEIKAKFKTSNPSPALTYLKKAGKIKVARKEGLKKFWKKA